MLAKVVTLDHQVHQVHLVQMGMTARLVNQVQKVPKAILVAKVKMETQDQAETRAHQDYQANQVFAQLTAQPMVAFSSSTEKVREPPNPERNDGSIRNFSTKIILFLLTFHSTKLFSFVSILFFCFL
jgi:hypothetical protein